MKLRAGKTVFESSFENGFWILRGEKETLSIPPDKIYNYFGNKTYKKTDAVTAIFIFLGAIFVSPWLLLVFAFPAIYLYHHLKRVRLDTEQGTIYVTFFNTEDKEEFLKQCKSNVSIQRWKNFNQKPDNAFFINLWKKATNK